MPIIFGLGYQHWPDLGERIKGMRDNLHGQLRHQHEQFVEYAIPSDGRVMLCFEAEETIRQVHRELALRSLRSEKNRKSTVDVFETLKTWKYLETKKDINESISMLTVINDLDAILMLLNTDATDRTLSEAGAPTPGQRTEAKDRPSLDVGLEVTSDSERSNAVKSDDQQDIGERLKQTRLQTGDKQEAVAEFVGCSVSTISRIERGIQHPGLHKAQIEAYLKRMARRC